MPLIQNIILAAIIATFAWLEIASGRHKNFGATRDDTKLEVFMFLSLIALSQPLIFAITGKLCEWAMPAQRGAWADWPWWGMAGVLLLADDLTQYAWHRVSHTPLLWPLHRAHHSAPHMGIRVVYRNNLFYYAMMPGIWISAFLVYLGLGAVYPWYILAKMLVIFGAHSELRWDRVLYCRRWLHPLAWLVERTISTPATHFAHHAIRQDDGIGYYKGNYGNFLFFWDVLFGTARITRQYPPRVGLQDDIDHGAERWTVQLAFPLLKSRRARSVLARLDPARPIALD